MDILHKIPPTSGLKDARMPNTLHAIVIAMPQALLLHWRRIYRQGSDARAIAYAPAVDGNGQ